MRAKPEAATTLLVADKTPPGVQFALPLSNIVDVAYGPNTAPQCGRKIEHHWRVDLLNALRSCDFDLLLPKPSKAVIGADFDLEEPSAQLVFIKDQQDVLHIGYALISKKDAEVTSRVFIFEDEALPADVMLNLRRYAKEVRLAFEGDVLAPDQRPLDFYRRNTNGFWMPRAYCN